MSVFRIKSVEQSLRDGDEPEYQLKKRLTALDLTVFGVGVVIGAGIFTVAGRAAKELAGPSVVLSFVVAAICCGLAALCYAEFASSIPISGSAYTFSYASLGEIVAWIIGWDLLLELMLGASVVAQGWSAYLGVFLDHLGLHHPEVGRLRLALRPAGLPAGRRADRPGEHRDQGVAAGQPGPRGAQALHRAVRHRRRHRLHQVGQLLALHPPGHGGEGQGDARVAAHRVGLRLRPVALRRPGHPGRRLARVLRLHRLRRRRDHGRGGQEPQPRPADRHHRLAHHLHGPLLRHRAKEAASPSASASTPVRSTPACCRSTARRHRRHSSSPPSGRPACSRSTTSTTSRSRSSTMTRSSWSRRTACWPNAATGRCTSASPRPAELPGHDQVRDGVRHPALRGHRRHHPRLAVGPARPRRSRSACRSCSR